MRHGNVEHREHQLLPLAYSQATDGIAVKANGGKRRAGLSPQVWIDAALHNAKKPITRARHKGGFRAPSPAHGKQHGFLRLFARGGIGRAFIKRHGDVAAQQVLDFDGAFGGKFVARSVEV